MKDGESRLNPSFSGSVRIGHGLLLSNIALLLIEKGRGVYAQSQLTIAEFAWRVHCGKEGHRFVAALQFKFDEIFDNRSMTLAGWLAEESEWRRLESQWQRCIDKQNAKHNPDKQITRFQNYPDFPGEPEG